MKTYVLYDSLYGNTEKIAQAIGKAISGEVKVAQVSKVDLSELKDLDILIIGSPVHGGRPSQATKKFLKDIPDDSLRNINVAAFDTRMVATEQSNFFMKLLIKTMGWAAPKIAKVLEKAGGNLVVEGEGFIVEGTKGPLKKGELERAGKWGREIENESKGK
jgi:flavodoxin I